MGNASQSLILGLCLVFGAFAACAQADDTPYTISKLVVDVTAKSAVTAKTNALAEAGKVVGIPLHDHVIVGGESFTSLAEKGIL